MLVALVLVLAGTAAAQAAGPPGMGNASAPDLAPVNQKLLNSEGLMLASQFLMLTEAAGKTDGNSTFLKPLMSPAYQIVRADGSRETPSTYTAPNLSSYEVFGAIATEPDPDVLVVRYYVASNETLHGKQLNTSRRPRLTVFARGAVEGDEGGANASWKLVSHAGFNEPMVLECDRGDDDPSTPPQGPAAALGVRVIREWMAAVRDGRQLDTINNEIQVQFANGSGFARRKEIAPIKPMPIDGYTRLIATRSGRLLVLSYYATSRVATRGRPHLTVFLEDGGPLAGNWSMIAQCNFNNPKLAPTDPACTGAGNAAGAPWGAARAPWVLVAAAALAIWLAAAPAA